MKAKRLLRNLAPVVLVFIAMVIAFQAYIGEIYGFTLVAAGIWIDVWYRAWKE